MRKILGAALLLVSSSAFAGNFGAIAYSPSTENTGGAWNFGCAEDARKSAIGSCGVYDCDWKVSVENECAAIAKGGSGGIGWAWADNRGIAEYRAMQRCGEIDRECRVINWICSKG